jgi:hypothetical protein
LQDLLGLLSFCNIVHGADEFYGAALLITMHFGNGMNNPPGSIRADHSILDIKKLIMRDGGIKCILNDVPVVWMDEVEEVLVGRLEFFGLDAANLIATLRPSSSILKEISLPMAEMAHFLCFATAAVGLSERFFGACVLLFGLLQLRDARAEQPELFDEHLFVFFGLVHNPILLGGPYHSY